MMVNVDVRKNFEEYLMGSRPVVVAYPIQTLESLDGLSTDLKLSDV